MNPHKVVEHEVQRYGVGQVLDFLAESVGQPRNYAYVFEKKQIYRLSVSPMVFWISRLRERI